MRDIKFRAWIKSEGVMRDYGSIGYCAEYDLLSFSGECGFNESYSLDSFEVMQYTGLKDKNGKEIYEGDAFKDGDFIYIVEMNLGAWIGNHHGLYMPLYDVYANDGDIDIIGNIHENPDLLEDK